MLIDFRLKAMKFLRYFCTYSCTILVIYLQMGHEISEEDKSKLSKLNIDGEIKRCWILIGKSTLQGLVEYSNLKKD